MSGQEPLDRLARGHGIEPAYHDIWGHEHPTPDQTRRALLRAMGVAIDDPAQVSTALAAIGTRPWRRVLAPVTVVTEGSPIRVDIHLPAARAGTSRRWRLVAENGERREGRVRPEELPSSDEREIDGALWRRYELTLAPLPLGYHRFALAHDTASPMTVIVAPRHCYLPPELAAGRRLWGPAAQLYALRSARNWGIGDFTDLQALATMAAGLGADMVGLNPLHALFPVEPSRCGPYRPSSRLFRNILYLDVEQVAELAECPEAGDILYDSEFQARLQALRETELVDYPDVAQAKLELLERLWSHFQGHHLGAATTRAAAFQRFRRDQGAALYRHALFEALQEHFLRRDPRLPDWPSWPEPYRRPDSPEVARFAAAHSDRIGFYAYLQWLVQLQLDQVGAATADMAIGLYHDLALSVDPAGAEAWAQQDLYALGASIGAPPDDFNLRGQDWGLPPPVPERLRDARYAPFIATLRQNMRGAGALRIDHVMGLMRLYCIPVGQPADQGAYVSYPLEDLLGIVALESQRNACAVIGEDLGTVPDSLREALARYRVLSYRVLVFEKAGEGEFRPPRDYPVQALATAGTHDLPTLSGFWEGRDLVLRAEHALFPSPELQEAQQRQRGRDRAALLSALQRERLLPANLPADPDQVPRMTEELASALHRYLGRSAAMLMSVQLEDLFGQREQVNLPGTVDEYPNWRRKLAIGLERYVSDGRLQRLARALAGEGRGQAEAAHRAPPAGHDPAQVVPRASYRLQLNAGFTFADARALVTYLDDLGISHCYASPCLKARPGSSHGYDIVDHAALNPELGTRGDFDAWTDGLRAAGMGLIMDIVPNHMGVMGADNTWWLDVLEHGQASAYAEFFDIDWQPLKPELRGKVLVPVLGDSYGAALENGDLRLALDPEAGSWSVYYHDHRFPLDPVTYSRLLRHQSAALATEPGDGNPALGELERLAAAFEQLPERGEPAPERRAERRRLSAVAKRELARVCAMRPEIGERLTHAVPEFFNGRAGEPATYEPLHQLLEAQAYRLAHWRVAADEINYRRFFDVNDLAGLRTENLRVFEATHRLVLQLVAQARIQGLRIDHPDGLYHPAQYLRRLRERLSAVAPAGHPEPPVYLVAEKILSGEEHLRADWPVHGTTGYAFASLANALQVERATQRQLTRVYNRFTGARHDFDETLYRARRHIMRVSLASELNVLANSLGRLSEGDWHTRDFTLNGLHYALAEILACFPVYRTYVTGEGVSEADCDSIQAAVAAARRRNPGIDTSVFDFIQDLLLLRAGQADEVLRWRVADLAMRVQQYTSALMAKGLEDTAGYRYHRLVSLNDVGGDPRRFGIEPAEFHRRMLELARQWPHGMLTTSTHDSKRSEDVRARINVLSELPREWQAGLARWRRLNRPPARGPAAPGREDEYLLYQTLVGTWPLEPPDPQEWLQYRERIREYMIKAAREAKTQTSWTSRDEIYETALADLVERVLDPADGSGFIADFAAFQRPVALLGAINSLSLCLLKLTCPGVPDLYQGSELWSLALVDPDNRRPVDFQSRRRALESLRPLDRQGSDQRAAAVARLLQAWPDGRIKLYLLRQGLALRRRRPELFRHGDYQPLEVTGRWARSLIAYARVTPGGDACIVLAPRLTAGPSNGGRQMPLSGCWADTGVHLPGWLADRPLVDTFTGSTLAAGNRVLTCREVLSRLPLALLETETTP